MNLFGMHLKGIRSMPALRLPSHPIGASMSWLGMQRMHVETEGSLRRLTLEVVPTVSR